MTDKGKTFYVDDIEYTRESVEGLRNELIVLRDRALEQNDFEWAVKLSHMISLWHSMINEIWGDGSKRTDIAEETSNG